jgi:hypothetical protein
MIMRKSIITALVAVSVLGTSFAVALPSMAMTASGPVTAKIVKHHKKHARKLHVMMKHASVKAVKAHAKAV